MKLLLNISKRVNWIVIVALDGIGMSRVRHGVPVGIGMMGSHWSRPVDP